MSIVYLRVKIRSLAEEARIIRHEEKRFPKGQRNNQVYFGLHTHRTYDVRNETRAALLAYAFLRKRRYRQIEPTCKEFPYPVATRVAKLVCKYGENRSARGEDFVLINNWLKDEETAMLEECH